MNDDALPADMKGHICENKDIRDYSSLALWLHKISNPAIEIVSFFTPNSIIELFGDMIAPKSGGGIEEIIFPHIGKVNLSSGIGGEDDLIKTYFFRYIEKLYKEYTTFESFGTYRTFENMKKIFSELSYSLIQIDKLSTSPNREDFRKELEKAENNVIRIGKFTESILNKFFYVIREIYMVLSKTDILEKYKDPKNPYWNWSTKEKVLVEFRKDTSDEVDEALRNLASVVHSFLDAYLVTDSQRHSMQGNIEVMKKKIRECRNQSAHQELELKDFEIILRSVQHCISQVESVVPRCCHVVRAELSPWITVLKLRMEGSEDLVEAYYPTEHLEKYTCFAKYEDVISASKDLDLFLAIPTEFYHHNRFFLVRYGEINNNGEVNYQSRFGSQSSLQELTIKIKLKESSLPEYTHIQEAI
jgi:hypothetical protein